MPEGDTVWLAAKRLDEALAGDRLVEADLRVPALATTRLDGAVVVAVVPRGKHLLFRLDDGRTLHTHFGMEGSWHLYRPDVRWRGGPAHTIRAVLRTQEWTAVGYRLTAVDLVPTDREADLVGHLGPDVLGPDWDLDVAVERLMRDPARPVGEALLDQRNLAGIGLIYESESLFACGVHPYTPVGEVPDLPAVVATAHRLMSRNAPRASQSTTGDERRPHYVHGRGRRPCVRCGTAIRTGDLGKAPRARIAYWCPACQPDRRGAVS